MIKCEICSKECVDLNSLSYHITMKHKDITKQKYYDKYMKQDAEGVCPVCGKETKFLGLRGYEKYCSRKCRWQNPEEHKNREETQINKYGKLYVQTDEFLEKRKQTNLGKYGVEYYSQTEECRNKIKQTSLEKYGVEFPTQSQEFIEKRRITYSKKSSQELENINIKRKEHFREKYGVDEYFQSDDFKKKAHDTIMERYKTDSYSHTQEFSDKCKATNLERYGAEYYPQTAEYKEKKNATQRKNHTLNSSNSEDEVFDYLVMIFPDVMRSYFNVNRYPFSCDFYIPEKDLFVECNFHWTHGGHWFNINNTDDINKVNEWKEKNTKYYNNAINTWTIRDTKKRAAAEENNLNYIVFWNPDDVFTWISLDCPSGKDYTNEYSWLPKRSLENRLNWKKLSCGKQTVINIAKKANFNEFYKRELDMWSKNIFNNSGTLQSNLFSNRLRYLNKNPNKLSDLEIIRGLNISGKVRAYSTFDNTGMMQFIEKYNIKSMYDPCAGWGERLVTCAALGIKYFGIDINEKTIEGHKEIIDYYGLTEQKTITEDSSKHTNKYNFDTTFTCPPYWNEELYTDKGAENLSYEEFLNWWKQTILMTNTRLFAYQINQKYKQDMNKVLETVGYRFIEEIKLPKKSSHFTRGSNGRNNKKEFESIQIFEKNNLSVSDNLS